jgi:drug/metabolite transporter (DMT)-like permease
VPPAAVLVGSSLLFAGMAVLAKLAARRLPGYEVAFIRFVVGCACCFAVSRRRPFRAVNKRGLLQRGALGGLAVLGYFTAIQHLPVGIATLLNYSAPVFTALWATLLLGERLTARAAIALGVTSCGVFLVVRGGETAAAAIGFWEIVGAVSAVLSGAAVATIREVRRTDGAWEIFASFCAAGLLITAGPTLARWTAPNGLEWTLMLLVGLTSVAAQLAMTWSLRYLRAAEAGIITQLTPVCALAIGALAFGERVRGVALGGAALVVGGVVWGALRGADAPAPAVEDP